ncbi:MAG: FAD-dependent oxidoreductase [Coriobacteriales bacterium]|jgi:succinate dehydrogenase/fumarate reductase flavoprotein subunit|nr:FAD-dependent oxidoreductase [Coriobacteriales bacterium]
MEGKKIKGLSRREFLKKAGVVTIGSVGIASAVNLAACTTPEESEPEELENEPETLPTDSINWDKEVDVVVVGYGGAGSVTAITAHDNGAEVLVIEKLARPGGNTSISGGGILTPNNLQQAITYFRGLYELSKSTYDEAIMLRYAEDAMGNVEWVQKLKPGTELTRYGGAGFEDIPGSESMDKFMIRAEGKTASQALFEILSEAVEQVRGIEVLLECPGKRLITDTEGAVIGVIANNKGTEIKIKARRGVVLTTGGYEFDQDMLRNNVKGYPIIASGCPGNTGDGVRMAQKVGAGLWHMNGASCGMGTKVEGFEPGFSVAGGASRPNFIWVDNDGHRFIDETNVESHAGLLVVDWYDHEELKYPRIPFYFICDENRRKQSAMGSAGGWNRGAYSWSTDNTAEIDKGWIKKGETLAELASVINVDGNNLAASVAEWNAAVAAGVDKLHGRAALGTVIEPPFYAIEMHPMLLNTQGGPQRNVKGQIVDPFGEPIPRLYSAGELGCMWGMIYQGAGNIGECIVYGKISGANVAAETPWDA